MRHWNDTRFPSIESLQAFEASARLGTFERAAEELAVTASAVSKRVASLEDRVGQSLLHRGGRSLTLTVVGKDYLGQVRSALSLLAAMPLHKRPTRMLQRLRVCSPPTFARQILVPALQEFTAAHPDVELEVVLSVPFLEVKPSGVDVEIRNGDCSLAGRVPLMRDVVLPVAAPSLLKRLKPVRCPADLSNADLLRTPIEPWQPWFRAAGLDWPEPTSGPRLVDLGMAIEAAVCGQGVALARPSLAQSWLASGTLMPLFNITAVPTNQYYLASDAHGIAGIFSKWLVGACERVALASLELLSGQA